MCGIIGHVGPEGALDDLLTGLQNLEYRGYDSAGVAVGGPAGIEVRKRKGTIEDLAEAVDSRIRGGSAAMGHTRWSTHGRPTDANAHPHTDCTGSVAVVHNGIITNHESLRERLTERGHEFKSETDTEVVPHLLEEALKGGADHRTAFQAVIDQLEGSYALVVLFEGDDALYATRDGSPLVLGVDDGRYFFASDVPAFLEFTDSVVYLEDGDVVTVDRGGYQIYGEDGRPVERSEEVIEWAADDAEKGGYDHYMFKEIHEQPSSLTQTLRDRWTADGAPDLDDLPEGSFSDVSRVHLVACGTSYHAAIQGEYLLSTAGVAAQVHLASEFTALPPLIDDDALVVGVTQSGETADTLAALQAAARRGARTLAVTNAPGSSAVRNCDDALFIRAGPEIGVAATKTFSSQVATLVLLTERLARDITGEGLPEFDQVVDALDSLPADVQRVLDTSDARALARRYRGSEANFFIGRGVAYPIALEGALKFKEITYEHAEGFAAGELKHGPLALVNENTPTFAVVVDPDDDKTLSNVREIQSRDGPVVAVAHEDAEGVLEVADESLSFPATHPVVAPVLANVHLQLVSYHVAELLSRSIDKPRNLAKSVTVE